MKPQDNAIRLVQEYHLMTGDLKVAIQCAYKAVDEIKKTMYPWQRDARQLGLGSVRDNGI